MTRFPARKPPALSWQLIDRHQCEGVASETIGPCLQVKPLICQPGSAFRSAVDALTLPSRLTLPELDHDEDRIATGIIDYLSSTSQLSSRDREMLVDWLIGANAIDEAAFWDLDLGQWR